MTFNPTSRTLSWSCLENATDVRCKMISDEMEPTEVMMRATGCRCTFNYMLLHTGVRFEVHATVQGASVREELRYPNPGLKDSAARNLSCFIYDASYLNCTWARGPAAPQDTQYFLFIANTRTHAQQECPLYTLEAQTHTGCHLRDLSLLGFNNYVLVNGTSAENAVQFSDSIWNTKQIERLSPPDNVTVRCNASHCCVTWKRPLTWTTLSYRDFQYQLDIQRRNADHGSENQLVDMAGQADNDYTFPSPEPRARHTVRIRVKDVRGGPWSVWSWPVEFGSDARDPQALRLYVPVVLSTLVCALVLGFLFKRFLGVRGLFPRIPQVKDKVSDVDGAAARVPWEDDALGLGKAECEEVLMVEEVS
ncbi:PREDICTED: granulocyte-macrophage colony-stimulating factor receptor subunit alpha-like [Chinchilla lanigera]|uniref:granulocyte-macrophage colony-stimulating factor receptor subunit alpha-like n=1 Tax=Chinchilla lanigera TaxID=34839 RepID=UPI000696D3B3|nr:PREDICTED: granulocyte-macrophage colony-stimulating factor receptor subunit alpha-like [Chinchilla lanigera]